MDNIYTRELIVKIVHQVVKHVLIDQFALVVEMDIY